MDKSQTEADDRVKSFLGEMTVTTKDDLVALKNLIEKKLEFRPYNDQTKNHADSIQWKRTALEIINDGYVYKGKACSDIALVFLMLCKAMGIDGCLVKLRTLDNSSTHTIVEVKLSDGWYRFDPSMKDGVPSPGQLADDQIWNKKWLGGWKIWKRGKDLKDLGLNSIDDEAKIRES
jgi:transglutaminase-like putative cysteine protease